jgi:hypothetical protein
MRKLVGALVALVAVLSIAGRGDSGSTDAALLIVDQAIQAHGGAEALAKTRSMIEATRGSITFDKEVLPFVCEVTLQLPEQCRWAYELEAGTQKVQVQLGINGEKGWRSGGGAVKEMVKLEVEEQRERAYASWLMTLLPLKENDTELAVLPEIKVGNEPAVGVQVTRKGRPEVKLYFDKKSHLLVKLERKAKDAGQEVTLEALLSEPKSFDGVKLASKRVELFNGKKIAEWTITSCKFSVRLEESVFAKP